MTKNYSNERFVPKQLTTKIRENKFVDFIWNNDKEKPSCIAYPKKGKNKIWWYRFKNVEQMNNRINDLISSYEEREKRKEKYQNEIRKLKKDGYKKVRKKVKGAITVQRPTEYAKSPTIEYWVKK